LLIWFANMNNYEPDQSAFLQQPPDDYTSPTPPPDYNVGNIGYGHEPRDAVQPPDLIERLFYGEMGGGLELPVNGATGWAATNLVLRAQPSTNAASVANLVPGNPFVILDGSVSDWWFVRLPTGEEGYVEIRRSFINFPDVLPSIIYIVTNARSSIFRSSGYALESVTYEALYSARSFNHRLGRYEYHVPGMYITARALFNVQQAALENGNVLIVYEIFRHWSAQVRTRNALNDLVQVNPRVAQAFTGRWRIGNFIAQGRSNHQLGAAVDTSIARVLESEILMTGEYSFTRVTSHRRVDQPSMMHELSPWAVLPDHSLAQIYGVADEIYFMQELFIREGFRPLASEWWHFDHIAGINMASSAGVRGEFYTPVILSIPPESGQE
jgi:D-alanyl-D-alanine dipeptidase